MSHLSIGEHKIYKVFLSCNIFLLPEHLQRETVHKSSSLLFRLVKWPKWWPLLYNALRLGFFNNYYSSKICNMAILHCLRPIQISHKNQSLASKKMNPEAPYSIAMLSPMSAIHVNDVVIFSAGNHKWNMCYFHSGWTSNGPSSYIIKIGCHNQGLNGGSSPNRNRHHNKRGEQKKVEIMVQDTYQTGVCEQWHLHLAWCQLSTLLVAAMLRHFLEPCELVLLLTMNSALQTTHDQHHKLLMLVKHIN